MIEKFQAELLALESYFETLASQKLSINQCEVSYINHIALEETADAGAWLRFLSFPDSCRPDDLTFGIRRVLAGQDGKPFARLIVEANSGFGPKGEQILVVTLTVRGAPHGSTVADAIKFIGDGREMIVTTFTDITTEAAQKIWERTQ